MRRHAALLLHSFFWLYVGMFQGNCQCWLLSHKSCACQTLNAPGSSIENGGGNKRAAVWVIISEQQQRYGINEMLLLSHPSAPVIGGSLQPAFPIWMEFEDRCALIGWRRQHIAFFAESRAVILGAHRPNTSHRPVCLLSSWATTPAPRAKSPARNKATRRTWSWT